MKISEIAAGIFVSLFILAFAGVFTWAGIGYGALPLYVQTRDSRAAENYVPVPAEVESVVLDDLYSKKGGTSYFTRAEFSYTFEGRPYRGKRVSFNLSADKAGEYQQHVLTRLLDAKSNNKPIEIWVDPNHPEKSVYDRSIRSDSAFTYLAVALMFTPIGLGFLFMILRGWWRIYAEHIKKKEWEASRRARGLSTGR
jgi:hypothetical protein